MERIFFTKYEFEKAPNEVTARNRGTYARYVSSEENFFEKKKFVKEKLNIDVNETEHDKYYFRIDKETNKIFYPYSRLIFEFNPHDYQEENSSMKCIIENHVYTLIDVDSFHYIEENEKNFIKTIDILKDSKTIEEIQKNKHIDHSIYENNETNEDKCIIATFDFKFTINDTDIDIFLPHIDILLRYIWLRDIEKNVHTIINNNLIIKKKGNKKLINLENTLKDINDLKKDTIPKIYERICKKIEETPKLKRWILGLSKTLANVFVQYYFTRLITNYTPHQDDKNISYYKK